MEDWEFQLYYNLFRQRLNNFNFPGSKSIRTNAFLFYHSKRLSLVERKPCRHPRYLLWGYADRRRLKLKHNEQKQFYRVLLPWGKLEILKRLHKTSQQTMKWTILWFNFAFNTTKFGHKSPAHVYLEQERACHNKIKF